MGHVVSQEGIEVYVKKVEAIQTLHAPQNGKELGRILGQIKWHAQFILFLANLATPMYVLMCKNIPYISTTQHNKLFETPKLLLAKVPMLCPPN